MEVCRFAQCKAMTRSLTNVILGGYGVSKECELNSAPEFAVKFDWLRRCHPELDNV